MTASRGKLDGQQSKAVASVIRRGAPTVELRVRAAVYPDDKPMANGGGDSSLAEAVHRQLGRRRHSVLRRQQGKDLGRQSWGHAKTMDTKSSPIAPARAGCGRWGVRWTWGSPHRESLPPETSAPT